MQYTPRSMAGMNNMTAEISAADDMRKQQQDLTNRLKSELQFFSVEEIERRIKALEHQQQTTSLSVKEDKKMMEDIKRLRSNIPLVKQYDLSAVRKSSALAPRGLPVIPTEPCAFFFLEISVRPARPPENRYRANA